MPIILGGKKITSFSNPLAVAVLQPTEEFIQQQAQYGLNAPVFLMLADIHADLNMKIICKKCTCDEGKKSCCMNVNKRDWLDLLTKVSTPDKPVDIFAESSTAIVTDPGQKQLYLADDSFSPQMIKGLRMLQKECFARHKNCGARYHLTDPRTVLMFALQNPNPDVPRYYYDSIVTVLLLGGLFTLVERGINMIMCMKRWANESHEFKQCLNSVLDDLLILTSDSNPATFTQRWTDMYFDSPWFDKNSLVAKQIRKCRGPLADKNTWKELSISLSAGHKSASVSEIMLKKLHNCVKECIRIFKDGGAINKSFVLYATLYNPTQILDLYNFGRAWKQPDGAMNSALVVSYQGHAHSVCQIRALTDHKMYNLVMDEPEIKVDAQFFKVYNEDKI